MQLNKIHNPNPQIIYYPLEAVRNAFPDTFHPLERIYIKNQSIL